MKDAQLRDALFSFVEDTFPDPNDRPVIFDDHAYDKSIVGVTEDSGRLVYDYAKMIEEFAEDEGCSLEEAQEWVDYNTIRALPYMGDHSPILITDITRIKDVYGG